VVYLKPKQIIKDCARRFVLKLYRQEASRGLFATAELLVSVVVQPPIASIQNVERNLLLFVSASDIPLRTIKFFSVLFSSAYSFHAAGRHKQTFAGASPTVRSTLHGRR